MHGGEVKIWGSWSCFDLKLQCTCPSSRSSGSCQAAFAGGTFSPFKGDICLFGGSDFVLVLVLEDLERSKSFSFPLHNTPNFALGNEFRPSLDPDKEQYEQHDEGEGDGDPRSVEIPTLKRRINQSDIYRTLSKPSANSYKSS